VFVYRVKFFEVPLLHVGTVVDVEVVYFLQISKAFNHFKLFEVVSVVELFEVDCCNYFEHESAGKSYPYENVGHQQYVVGDLLFATVEFVETQLKKLLLEDSFDQILEEENDLEHQNNYILRLIGLVLFYNLGLAVLRVLHKLVRCIHILKVVHTEPFTGVRILFWHIEVSSLVIVRF